MSEHKVREANGATEPAPPPVDEAYRVEIEAKPEGFKLRHSVERSEWQGFAASSLSGGVTAEQAILNADAAIVALRLRQPCPFHSGCHDDIYNMGTTIHQDNCPWNAKQIEKGGVLVAPSPALIADLHAKRNRTSS